MDIMSGLQGDLGSNGAALALQNVMSVLQQAIVPYAEKITTRVQKLKKAGRKKATCFAKGYKMINKLMTKAEVRKIMQQVKNSVGTQSWSSVNNRMSGVLKFSQYTLTK
uniref:Sperm-lysin n=1 Tax=Acrobeloides nanus TaxID=290746 RepID=A0A914D2B5_9BILA